MTVIQSSELTPCELNNMINGYYNIDIKMHELHMYIISAIIIKVHAVMCIIYYPLCCAAVNIYN